MTVKCLSSREKNTIYEKYTSGARTQVWLASYYGVSTDTIRRVIKELSPKVEETKPKKVPKDAVIKPVEELLVWTANKKFVSITVGTTTYNADSEHPKFNEAVELLALSLQLGESQAREAVMSAVALINTKKAIERFVSGDVRIEGGSLYYKDLMIDSGLTRRIIETYQNGGDFEFYIPFLKNLMKNPSRKAVYRLYDFLEANDIEITKDGHFIAWKKVRDDFKDIYTGTMDNSPGTQVSVERNQVDEDDEVTCSHGLHVCSKSYLNHYGFRSKNVVVKVKVHPQDVVAIPRDYNNAKMRTCGYYVLEQV